MLSLGILFFLYLLTLLEDGIRSFNTYYKNYLTQISRSILRLVLLDLDLQGRRFEKKVKFECQKYYFTVVFLR